MAPPVFGLLVFGLLVFGRNLWVLILLGPARLRESGRHGSNAFSKRGEAL